MKETIRVLVDLNGKCQLVGFSCILAAGVLYLIDKAMPSKSKPEAVSNPKK